MSNSPGRGQRGQVTDQSTTDDAQALLAAIVESSDDAIISKTLEGQILSWNGGAERIFGYSAEEAKGQHISLIIPSDRREEETTIVARLRRGERIEHFETVRVAKDGRRIDMSLTISPIRDRAGRIVAASKIGRDITARKRSNQALVELNDELAVQLADLGRLHEMSVRLSKTVELQPILIEALRTVTALENTELGLVSLCDAERNRLEVAASLGFDEDGLQGIGRISAEQDAFGACLRERQRIVVEDVLTDPAFKPFRDVARRAGFRAVHSSPLITRSGEVVGVLTTFFTRPHRPSDRETRLVDLCVRQAVDFIENARLYVKLRDADRLKDEFLATLAHELRNPLAPISNSLHILRLSDDLSPSVQRVREIMEQQVQHMVRLVDDLLEVSRISRGKIDLQKERVELAAMVHNAVEFVRPQIEAARHQLAIALPPEPLTLEVDPVRITQVIGNLLTNAVKYTSPGGQIWVTARCDGDAAVISVRDTGVGIPADMLQRIFDMFTQVDRTLSRSQGGLGIGLTLARNLIAMHGGSIEARSAGLGKGSEFVVRLPMVREAAPAPRPVVSPPSATRPVPQRRILVVDDARAAAYILTRLLELMGQEVQSVGDGFAALKIARSMRPDIIFSDIAMPTMDGCELARRLRQEPELEGTVLVALTGFGQEEDRRRIKEAGYDYHLVKPVSLETLESLLASLATMPGGAFSGSRPQQSDISI